MHQKVNDYRQEELDKEIKWQIKYEGLRAEQRQRNATFNVLDNLRPLEKDDIVFAISPESNEIDWKRAIIDKVKPNNFYDLIFFKGDEHSSSSEWIDHALHNRPSWMGLKYDIPGYHIKVPHNETTITYKWYDFHFVHTIPFKKVLKFSTT